MVGSPENKRIQPRVKIPLSLAPGPLLVERDRKEPLSIPLDVSVGGLGAFVFGEFPIGESFVMPTAGVEIRLKIVWGKQVTTTMFRYGFKSEDDSIDLRHLFEKAGCLVHAPY